MASQPDLIQDFKTPVDVAKTINLQKEFADDFHLASSSKRDENWDVQTVETYLKGSQLNLFNELGEEGPLTLTVPSVVEAQTDWPLWWFSPFFDRTSFGKEASTIILGAMRSGALNRSQVWLGTTEGDCSLEVDNSMPRADFDELAEAVRRADPRQAAIVVCHSLPPFWSRPKNKWPTCAPCPPIGYTAAMAIGRAMAETDIYNSEFVRICNTMDEIWVPSKFSRDTLIASGVPSEKLRVVPIAVNVTMFDPKGSKGLRIPAGRLVFGTSHRVPSLSNPLHVDRSSIKDSGGKEELDFMLAIDSIDTIIQLRQEKDLGFDLKTSRDEVENALSRLESYRNSNKVAPLWLMRGVMTIRPQHLSTSLVSSQLLLKQVRQWVREMENGSSGSQTADEKVKAKESALLSIHKSFTASKDLRSTRQAHQEANSSRGQISGGKRHRRSKPFAFVSTFKWEMRKGWDVLLAAYLQEFSSEDDVELYILTKPFANSGDDFVGSMQTWASEHLNMTKQGDRERGPALYVISQHMTAEEYVGLYKSTDCYVIPTRGEGWGMPITEAMSMGLPAIVTNWSGTTDFVDDRVGYLVNYSLSSVPDDQPWWFRGARWADASVDHLRSVMRHVYEHPEEAAMKGQRARQLMSDLYSPEAVGRMVASEVERIKRMLRAGNCTHCFNSTYVAKKGQQVTKRPAFPMKLNSRKLPAAFFIENSTGKYHKAWDLTKRDKKARGYFKQGADGVTEWVSGVD